ncbi:sensor histidine kinase [Georgenia sunbinii]|uniref:sensor histidine kinase n=1 Tax=Georgenia sunbinii TaxID=3117728 RepID=UPI002F26B63F
MDEIWAIVVVGLLGLVVGFVVRGLVGRRSRDGQPVTGGDTPLTADARALLLALRSSVLVLDASDDVVEASPAAYSYGLVKSGRLVHPPMVELVNEVRVAGSSRHREITLPRGPLSGAGVLILQLRAAPLSGHRVLIVADDQTAARRLDQMRRDFVANVSHELKTPVGALSLLAETVSDAADDAEAVRRFSGQMRREARRLAILVKEIIDLSRLQEPDALVDSALVPVDDVIEEACDRVRVEADSRKITMGVGGDRGLYIFGDADLLATAVRNLLDNALRHSAPLSRVSVAVGHADGNVTIAVVDQGEGIHPEEQRRVFERFYRGDPARARKTGGTGLGLSIVKHIAADHGGEVDVWSKPGAGSTFTLTIPIAQPPVPTDGAPGAGTDLEPEEIPAP